MLRLSGRAALRQRRRSALERGLSILERSPKLGAFDAVLAATALEADADALVSADGAFAEVARLRFVELGSPALRELIAED